MVRSHYKYFLITSLSQIISRILIYNTHAEEWFMELSVAQGFLLVNFYTVYDGNLGDTVGHNRSSTLTHNTILNSDEGQWRSNIR